MRRKVLDAIGEWYGSDRRSALMIRGARQCGKTYAVERFCEINGIHSIRVDLAKDEESRRAFDGNLTVDEIVLRLSAEYPDFDFIPGRTLIFLDEIQECPRARTALKSFAEDNGRRYRVVASGSLLGLHMRDVPLPPTGYVEEVGLGPMDFEEFLWALGVPEAVMDSVRSSLTRCEAIDGTVFESLSKYYSWYLVVGGMPEAVREFVGSRQFAPVRRVHGKILGGYREDMEKHTGDTVALRSKVEACFDAIPRMLATENKRFMFNGVSPSGEDCGDVPDADDDRAYNDGYSRYARALDWLAMAGMTLSCHRVSEMHMPLEERTKESMFKLYMLDTGLLMHLYEPELIAEVVAGNLDVNSGAIAENAIAEALSVQGRPLYYFRNQKMRMELDFVLVVDGKVCAVEVKSGGKRDCSSLNKAIRDMHLGGIMFETRNCFVDDKGVRHYPLFAASFMDSIDHREMPEFDFDSLDRLKRIYGGDPGAGERSDGAGSTSP